MAIKTLAETGYFEKGQRDKLVLKYMRMFYKNVLKKGRAVPFTLRKSTLYTCKYVFPPTRGYPQGRPCVDDVYGRPDPDCPACNGVGHPQKTDKYKDIRVMGFMTLIGQDTLEPQLMGRIDESSVRVLVGLPIPQEYTNTFGLLPKTDIRDAKGNVTESDVYIGYPIALDDTIIWTQKYWDGMSQKIEETEYVVVASKMNKNIGYYQMFQDLICNLKNVNSRTPSPARLG